MALSQLLLCFFLAWVPACSARPSQAHLAVGDSEDQRAEALKRLLQVFGIMDIPPRPQGVKQPPQYMVDLYNTVAGADGVTKDPDILEGNTVRSFWDKCEYCHTGGGSVELRVGGLRIVLSRTGREPSTDSPTC